jgi:hypothetical protein
MPTRFQEMLKVQRENKETARVGLRWDDGEDDKMLSMIREGKTVEEVASFLQRTPGSIKTRLVINAVNKIENESFTHVDAANYACISEDEITEFLQKKEERLNKRQSYKNKKNENVSINQLVGLVNDLKKRVENLESK